jgi:hypothetical protein
VAAAVRALAPHPLRGMAVTSPDGTCFRATTAGRSGPIRRSPAAPTACCWSGAREAGVESEGTRRPASRLPKPWSGPPSTATGPSRCPARLVAGPTGGVVARRLPRCASTGACASSRCADTGRACRASRSVRCTGGGGYCGVAPSSPTRANVTFVVD